ncbi:hypothetical protein CXB40_30585 [Pseudomonas syringae pv. avii]|nr:hypothetical protein CXB40_30585 [Pseudomonas syringae pv. avii]
MPFRNMVLPPKLRSMTQGSVFNFARSDDFNQDVWGMVISARCDLAQNKQEKFIYVPLVKAKAWFDSYLIPKLMEENRKALFSDLKQILVQNGNAESAIYVFGTARCAELLTLPKEHNRYLKKLADLDHIQSCLGRRCKNSQLSPPLAH